MQPPIDQAIIANMQKGWMAKIYGVILLGGFLVMMIAGIQGYKKVFGYSALAFLVSFIVIYNITTRAPKCSICGGKLHQINQPISGGDLKHIYESPGAPIRIRLGSRLMTGYRPNQSIQGYECYHCRKMAILG